MENIYLPYGCPVMVCTRRFLHLSDHGADLNTPMCVYFERKGAEGKSVTSNHFVALLKLWADKTGFARLGFHPHEIVSQSLLLGVAMTMHQGGQSDITIKVIGRWRSDAFLVYFQGQVDILAKSISVSMKQVVWFTRTSRPHKRPLLQNIVNLFPLRIFPQWPPRLRVPYLLFPSFRLSFNLLFFCSYVASVSTEGQAIKSLFFAIPSTYYIIFYHHIVRLVRVSGPRLQKSGKTH